MSVNEFYTQEEQERIMKHAYSIAEKWAEYEESHWGTITRLSNNLYITLDLDAISTLRVFYRDKVVLQAEDTYYGDMEIDFIIEGEWIEELLEAQP